MNATLSRIICDQCHEPVEHSDWWSDTHGTYQRNHPCGHVAGSTVLPPPEWVAFSGALRDLGRLVWQPMERLCLRIADRVSRGRR